MRSCKNMSNEDEFWKALADSAFVAPLPIEHKIYYDAKGNITDCTIEDKDGDYIIVDLDAFIAIQMGKYKVKNGEIHNMSLSSINTIYLEKVEDGNFKTVKNNMLILADDSITERDSYVSK